MIGKKEVHCAFKLSFNACTHQNPCCLRYKAKLYKYSDYMLLGINVACQLHWYLGLLIRRATLMTLQFPLWFYYIHYQIKSIGFRNRMLNNFRASIKMKKWWEVRDVITLRPGHSIRPCQHSQSYPRSNFQNFSNKTWKSLNHKTLVWDTARTIKSVFLLMYVLTWIKYLPADK